MKGAKNMNENFQETLPKVYIAGLNTSDDTKFSYEMQELENLCKACSYEVVGSCYQNASSVNPSTYFGSGKIKEIRNICLAEEVSICIINDELTPSQMRNIANIFNDEVVVMDRTMLVLEIFEKRAKTKEAKLQVLVARLKYSLPRLIGIRSYMSRTTGGASTATRGAGETKLELDRRHIKEQILKAEKELEAIKKVRLTSRKARKNNQVPVVALVGYTNAGKSTIMNYFINHYRDKKSDKEKEVYEKDMLFATLETSTRSIVLDNNHHFLLTDTVGFVSKLPHHLVESFKSTLEEITEAALLIHVVDASSPFFLEQMTTTKDVLVSLGAQTIPTITFYNKMDLVKCKELLGLTISDIQGSKYEISSYENLKNSIDETLFKDYFLTSFLIPYEKTGIYNYLKDNYEVVSNEFTDRGILVKAYVHKKEINHYHEYIL